jgi:hypothetical protein
MITAERINVLIAHMINEYDATASSANREGGKEYQRAIWSMMTLRELQSRIEKLKP